VQKSTVEEQLWAWLYTNGRTVKMIKQGDEYVKVGLTRKEVNKSVSALLDPLIDDIITAHDWDFSCDVATETSVANQSEYTLRGNNDDCADLWVVKYGPGRGVPLEESGVAQMDRREAESVADASDNDGVYTYTRFGRSDDGFPKIQLFDTPGVGNTITYRYRKMDLGLGDIPDRFSYVVRDFLRAEYDAGYLPIAEGRLNKMIAKHTIGGDSPRTVRMHPTIETGNIRRSGNQGGC
jgi:hypothetical protein